MTIDLADYQDGVPLAVDYEQALGDVQKRLAHLQVAHIVHGCRSIVLLEGWDAAGKGGIIQRLTSHWDPRHNQVWPIGTPTVEERGRHFLWRFWKRLPGPGQIAVFDRSWYGRVLADRIEGYANEAQWRRAYDEINEFEAQQREDGVSIIKLFIHVTQETQDERLRARMSDPWKRWKATPEDFRNRALRDEYAIAIEDMFRATDTRWAPWRAIDGNNKQAARIAALTAVADAMQREVPADPPEPDEAFMRYALAQLTADSSPKAD